jgi:hypothetical protein
MCCSSVDSISHTLLPLWGVLRIEDCDNATSSQDAHVSNNQFYTAVREDHDCVSILDTRVPQVIGDEIAGLIDLTIVVRPCWCPRWMVSH